MRHERESGYIQGVRAMLHDRNGAQFPEVQTAQIMTRQKVRRQLSFVSILCILDSRIFSSNSTRARKGHEHELSSSGND